MAASEPGSGVQMRSREESESFRARVQFRKSHSGPPKMEGYLRKRTAKLNLKWFWRKYWFVLDGRSLLYFKSESNYNSLGTCKGLVDFGLVQAVRPSHGSKNIYAMEVITRSDVIHLAADDWQTRQVWVAALQAAIQISEVSWPFKVQLDNAPKLVQMQRGEICNSAPASDCEGRRSRHNDRGQKTSSLIIYENVSIETTTQDNEVSSDRRPSSEGAIYQQISEAESNAHDSEQRASDGSGNALGKARPCSHTKKDKGYGGMLRRARSFSCGLMSAKGRLTGFHRHRDKSAKTGNKVSPSRKHDSSSASLAQTPDSSRVSKDAETASHKKQDSVGSVRSGELPSGQTSSCSNRASHQKQGSTGSANLRHDPTMPAARNQIASFTSSGRDDERRITACLDVNPTYQTAGESRGDGLATEPTARKRYNSSSCQDEDFVPECPSRPHPPSPMPRSDVCAAMPSRDYGEVYENHVPPPLVDKVGDDERQRKKRKPPNLRLDQIDAMIPNCDYAEVRDEHVLPSPRRRSVDDASQERTCAAEQSIMKAPSWEYAEIDDGPSLSRTFSSPPCVGSVKMPLARRPSNPESSVSRKTSKDSADDSSLHIYQEVRGSSRSPSPQPSPRTVFMASTASSTRPADMEDEEESYYSSISEEDLRRYQWSSDLARVGETSETGTESSTYNTADASGSSEALAETGYMEDNPHITITATDSSHSSSGSSRIGTAPSSEAMRELRELLDCLGTENDGSLLTGQRSIARARQLLVREMAANEA
ncbi:DNA topoisomerase 1-like [Dermacentor albipictus]|uniref:DNA topoisomerase 1-like n=1 Tax=Dermacentor albipictus TaxID=60249 RepID=UPI0038FD016E